MFELLSFSKTVFTVQNQYLHSNIGDDTLLQAIHGGTRPKVGGAHDKF